MLSTDQCHTFGTPNEERVNTLQKVNCECWQVFGGDEAQDT